MTLPRRIKKQSVNKPWQSDRIRCPGHLQFVRSHECCVRGFHCNGPVQAAHVRSSFDGGMGIKPDDSFVISLCAHHHRRQHDIGEAAFERHYGINMLALAAEFAAKSDPLRRYLARKRAA